MLADVMESQSTGLKYTSLGVILTFWLITKCIDRMKKCTPLYVCQFVITSVMMMSKSRHRF